MPQMPQMPYPNEHSCRLKPPNYKRYARKNCYQKHEGKCIDYVFGIISPNESELQSMRYKKDVWTAEDARKHCKSEGGDFEEASGEQDSLKNRWYSMETKDADEAEISIFEEIGGWGGIGVAEFKKDFDAIRGKKHIRLLLNSPGGDVFDGMAIYNILVQVRSKLEVRVIGIAASAASVIALAGQELVMAQGSYLMIHNPSGLCIGDHREMQKMAEILEKITGTIAKVYAGESNLTKEEALAAMAAETWYTATEAMEAGFADSVEDYGDVTDLAFDLDKFQYAHVPQAVRDRIARRPVDVCACGSPATEPAQPAAAAIPTAAESGDEPVHTEDEEMKSLKQVLDAFAAFPEEERAKVTEEDRKKIAELFGFSKLEGQIAELTGTVKALQGKTALLEEKLGLLLAENEAKAKELAALKLEKARAEKVQAIEKALSEGKIAPVNRALWEGMYDKDPEGTRKLLESQQPVVDLSERGVGAGGEEPDLTPEELAMAKKAGLSKEDVDKYGPKEGAGKEK